MECEMWCSSEAGKFQCIRYGHHRLLEIKILSTVGINTCYLILAKCCQCFHDSNIVYSSVGSLKTNKALKSLFSIVQLYSSVSSLCS